MTSLTVKYHNLADNQHLADALESLQLILSQRPTSLDEDLVVSIQYLKNIITEDKVKGEQVTEIGELGSQLLEALFFESRKTTEQQGLFNYIALSFNYWIARNGGTITQLEFCVNSLAQAANTLNDKVSLESLYEATTFIISRVDQTIINSDESSAPGNPWKVLIINYGIIATRTYNPDLMESAYQTLIEYFPQEAAGFFTQAMSEMTRLNYPQHVRSVVSRYHQDYHLNPCQ
jgi:hypothetical protein